MVLYPQTWQIPICSLIVPVFAYAFAFLLLPILTFRQPNLVELNIGLLQCTAMFNSPRLLCDCSLLTSLQDSFTPLFAWQAVFASVLFVVGLCCFEEKNPAFPYELKPRSPQTAAHQPANYVNQPSLLGNGQLILSFVYLSTQTNGISRDKISLLHPWVIPKKFFCFFLL